MDNGFNKYKKELEQVRLTEDSKKTLVRVLTERESGKAAKRRSKRGRMVLVTAMLALGALALLAAAKPGFWSVLGVHHSVRDPGNGQPYHYSYFGDETQCPVEVVEGRVWFIFDGRRIDITGQFDEKHAYIYEATNPETGLPNYILVGWSAGGIGYGEVVLMPGEEDGDIHAFTAHTLGVVWMDPDYPIFDHTYPVDEVGSNSGDWFSNAVEELCAPYLEKICPTEETYEAQPSMTDTAAPDLLRPSGAPS